MEPFIIVLQEIEVGTILVQKFIDNGFLIKQQDSILLQNLDIYNQNVNVKFKTQIRFQKDEIILQLLIYEFQDLLNQSNQLYIEKLLQTASIIIFKDEEQRLMLEIEKRKILEPLQIQNLDQFYQDLIISDIFTPQLFYSVQGFQIKNIQDDLSLHIDPKHIIATMFMIGMQEVFKVEELLPCKLQPKLIFQEICNVQLQEFFHDKAFKENYQKNLQIELQSLISSYDEIKNEINDFSIQYILKQLEVINKLLKVPEKISFSTIQELLKVAVETKINDNNLPQCCRCQIKQYKLKMSALVQNFFQSFALSLQNIIQFITYEEIEQKNFLETLNAIFIKELPNLMNDFSDFEDTNLFLELKQFLYEFLKEINMSIYKSSIFATEEMQNINNILKDYPSLANVKTYQVQTIQREVSEIIINRVKEIILVESLYFRPEFNTIGEDLVKKTIGVFYDYSQNLHDSMRIPQTPRKFKDLFQGSYHRSIALIPYPYKRIKFRFSLQIQENLLIESFCSNLNNLHDFNQLSIEEIADAQVLRFQDFTNLKNKKIVVCVEILIQKIFKHCFFIELRNDDEIIIARSIFWLNTIDWSPLSPIENSKDLTFESFARIRIKMGDFYNQRTENNKKLETRKSYQGVEINQVNIDELNKFKTVQVRKISPQNQLQIGNRTGVAMASGCIGAGIGCLILDSMDDKIPWDEKLKRAGYVTVTSGILTSLMLSMPALGALLQQVYLTYVIKNTITNKVVSNKVKATQVGHIGIQSTVGVSSAIAGQMLIPIPVVGAIIGSAVGGIMVGIYQKVVVMGTKGSIMKMLQQLSNRIQSDGLVLYSDDIIKTLQINKSYFQKNKPECFTDSEWLTVILVCLINEVYYLISLSQQEQTIKLQQKLDAKPEDQKIIKKLDEIENGLIELNQKNGIWNVSRKFIVQNKLSLYKNAEQIGTFVQGMISNFKL